MSPNTPARGLTSRSSNPLPDSIDLQDRDAPSAKDHTTTNQPKTSSNGSLGPHQAETLRGVAAETAQERRLSWNTADMADLQQYAEQLTAGAAGKDRMNDHQQQDALAIAQNGGQAGTEDTSDDGELDGDEDADLDDDMMDKTSSSPSIEDGGYISVFLPPADNTRRSTPSPRSSRASVTVSEAGSSSPYLDLPDHLPLHMAPQRTSEVEVDTPGSGRHHHLRGERNQGQAIPFDASSSSIYSEYYDGIEGGTEDEPAAYAHLESGTCYPWTSDSSDLEDAQCPGSDEPNDQADNMELDEGLGGIDWEEDRLTIPYEGSSGDDDDDFSCTDDSRFIDSGWGGECLHDAEDIDFDFVYALHTFVATVEGQANATKGDTMVLLDDSNSYWWLVRVVKDSSIGMACLDRLVKP